MAKRILIVDDDLELCQELAEILRDEGYDVDETSDSGRGATLIQSNRYDACLLDYKMSGLNGLQLARKVKEKDPASAVFIISGGFLAEKMVQQENAGSVVSATINKPFDVAILLNIIKSSI